MSIEDLRRRLRDETELKHGSGASDAQIEEALTRLGGGKFPTEYAAFLQTFGWLMVRHYEVFGLGADLPPEVDLVETTLDEREHFGLPGELAVIGSDGGGNSFCVDTDPAGTSVSTEEILIWGHELSPTRGPEVVESSFSAWMIDRLSAPPVTLDD